MTVEITQNLIAGVYMRSTILILFILLAKFCLSQPEPVAVDLQITKKTGHQYELQFLFTVLKGWHVYATGDSVLSLDAVNISVDNENCTLAGEGIDTRHVSEIRDLVFGYKTVSVYKGDFSLHKILFINDVIPPVVKFTIKAFVSDNKEFIPVELTRRVPLTAADANAMSLKIPAIDVHAPLSDCADSNMASSRRLLAVFLLGCGGGLLVLFALCMFSMDLRRIRTAPTSELVGMWLQAM